MQKNPVRFRFFKSYYRLSQHMYEHSQFFFAFTKIEPLEQISSSWVYVKFQIFLPKLVNFMITPANNSKLQQSASIDTLL